MKIGVEIAESQWEVDAGAAVELAISLDFNGKQPRAFGLSPARAEAVKAGDFVGDTRRGGSANCETLRLTPHGNGTHTEGVGHLTEERIALAAAASDPLMATALLTVPSRDIATVDESYGGTWAPGDRVVCAQDLQQSYGALAISDAFLGAVCIAVEAFDPQADHSGTNPPYLTTEAVQWLRRVGCRHLLVELPSVDRESDGGSLPNHHLFFGVEHGKRASEQSRKRTITELIDVPQSAVDGPYALSLRFPHFQSDAAPSRPILYPLRPAQR